MGRLTAKQRRMDDIIKCLLALKPGQRLRHANGTVWTVRAVLAEDARAVVRFWIRSRRYYVFDIVAPIELHMGLWQPVFKDVGGSTPPRWPRQGTPRVRLPRWAPVSVGPAWSRRYGALKGDS